MGESEVRVYRLLVFGVSMCAWLSQSDVCTRVFVCVCVELPSGRSSRHTLDPLAGNSQSL